MTPPFSTSNLFRDVAADIVRRRDAAARGESSPAAANDAKIIDAYRWREAALSTQREIDEMWTWLYGAMQRSSTFSGPGCLANVQTKDQLRQFMLDLLLPDLVEIIQGVFEGMQHANQGLSERSEEDGSGEGEGQDNATVANAGIELFPDEVPAPGEKDIPF